MSIPSENQLRHRVTITDVDISNPSLIASNDDVTPNIIAIGCGNKIVLYDVSDIDSPSKYSTFTDASLNAAVDMQISGAYLFVLDISNDKLLKIDISDPFSPTKVLETSIDLNQPRHILVKENGFSEPQNVLVANDGNNDIVCFFAISLAHAWTVTAAGSIDGISQFFNPILGPLNFHLLRDGNVVQAYEADGLGATAGLTDTDVSMSGVTDVDKKLPDVFPGKMYVSSIFGIWRIDKSADPTVDPPVIVDDYSLAPLDINYISSSLYIAVTQEISSQIKVLWDDDGDTGTIVELGTDSTDLDEPYKPEWISAFDVVVPSFNNDKVVIFEMFDADESSSSEDFSESSLSESVSSSSSSSGGYSTSSSSSEGISSSTSSGDFPVFGTTYYSEFRDINSINNPILGKDIGMKYSGFFDIGWDTSTLDINNSGYGLRKTKNNQGAIFCEDASRLFSMENGYLGITLNFPSPIVSGVYQPLKDDIKDINEYMLWGVNVGQYETGQPSLYASLTPRGIEFTIKSSKGFHTIRDTSLNADANEDIFIELIWDSNEIDNYLVRSIMKIDGEIVAAGNQPIGDDSLTDLNFYVLNTPFGYNNMECVIKRLVAYNEIPPEIEDELWSSSSSSFSSSSSESSAAGRFFEQVGSITRDRQSLNSIWGDGTYIYTGQVGAAGLYGGRKSYTFDGSSFTLIDEEQDNSTTSVWGDGIYVYESLLNNGTSELNAYDGPNFNLSLQAANQISSNFNVWGAGGRIIVAVANDINNVFLRAYSYSTLNLLGYEDNLSVNIAFAVYVWGDGIYIYVSGFEGNSLPTASSYLRVYTFDGAFNLVDEVITGVGGAEQDYHIYGDGSYIYTVQTNSNTLLAYSFNGSTLTLEGSTQEGLGAPNLPYQSWSDGTYVYVNTLEGLRAYTFNGSDFTMVGALESNGGSAIWSDGTYIYADVRSNNPLVDDGTLRAYTINP